MTLSVHGAVGAAIVALVPASPIFNIILAFVSHFALDSLPHWDYRILSIDKAAEKDGLVRMVYNQNFIKDIIRIGADGLGGVILAILIFRFSGTDVSAVWVIGGGVIAMFPDFLQFVYGRIGTTVLGLIQKIHNYCHTRHRFLNQPALGISMQVGLVVLLLIITAWL